MQQAELGPATLVALVVDDSAVFRSFIKMYLQGQVGLVLEADDGDTAWALLEKNKVDIIISDLAMPRVSGLDFLRKLRGSPDKRVRTLPFVLLTADQDTSLVTEATAAGADEFVHKPVKPSALRGAVSRLLALKPS